MIEYVNGKPRKGKTSYVVAKIMNEHMRFFNEEYQSCKSYLKSLNKSGFNLTEPPERHVVSSNFDIYRKYPTMLSYHISGYEFGIPNPKAPEVKKLIPYGVYAFDEIQRYWDSKGDDSKLPPWVTQAFELHGHIFLTIYLIAQRYMRLNKDIRDLVNRFVYIENSIHTFVVNGHKVKTDKFIPGKLIKTEWFGREFNSDAEYEAYLTGKEPKAGEKFYYEFEGDIRNHYNPHNYSVDIQNNENDFDYDSELNDTRPASWDNWKKEQKKNENKK